MATEMGAIIIFFTPDENILDELEKHSGIKYQAISADPDAKYEQELEIDISGFRPMLANPGHPHDNVDLEAVKRQQDRFCFYRQLHEWQD